MLAYVCLGSLLIYPFFFMGGYRDFKSSSFADFCRFAGVSVEYPAGVFDGQSDCGYLLESTFGFLAIGAIAAFLVSFLARLVADRSLGTSPQ
jgi:hypothetical protein